MISHTRTHTYAKVDRSTRDTVDGNGDLVKIRRKPTPDADAFYLPGGHYKVETINGEITIEAPVWIVFDGQGYPYPVEPKIFEETWEVVHDG